MMTTIRIVLSIMVEEELHVKLDVKTVFLHDDLKEDIYAMPRRI